MKPVLPKFALAMCFGIQPVAMPAFAQQPPLVVTPGVTSRPPVLDQRTLDLQLSTQRAEQRRMLEQQRRQYNRAQDRQLNSPPRVTPDVPIIQPNCRSSGSRLSRIC